MADEEALAVVVGVDEPAGDVIGRRTADLAGRRVVDIDAFHFDDGAGQSGTGPILSGTERDRSDIVKLGGPADVRAIFNRARHFDFGPPFAGDPWDDRPTLGPNVARFPSAIPAGQRGGLVARCGESLPVPARCRFD